MGPISVIPDESICEDDELSHDSGYGDFCGFAGCSQAFVFCLEKLIKSGNDEGGHIERLPKRLPTTLDDAFALPLAGLAVNGGKVGQACSLLVFERT